MNDLKYSHSHLSQDEILDGATVAVAEIDESVAESDIVNKVLTENETEDSFHSDNNQISVYENEDLISNISTSSEDLISRDSSIDSQLSWLQEHYSETNENIEVTCATDAATYLESLRVKACVREAIGKKRLTYGNLPWGV